MRGRGFESTPPCDDGGEGDGALVFEWPSEPTKAVFLRLALERYAAHWVFNGVVDDARALLRIARDKRAWRGGVRKAADAMLEPGGTFARSFRDRPLEPSLSGLDRRAAEGATRRWAAGSLLEALVMDGALPAAAEVATSVESAAAWDALERAAARRAAGGRRRAEGRDARQAALLPGFVADLRALHDLRPLDGLLHAAVAAAGGWLPLRRDRLGEREDAYTRALYAEPSKPPAARTAAVRNARETSRSAAAKAEVRTLEVPGADATDACCDRVRVVKVPQGVVKMMTHGVVNDAAQRSRYALV